MRIACCCSMPTQMLIDGKALLADLPLSLPLPFAFPFPLSPPLSARLLLCLHVPVGEVVTRRGPSLGNGGQRHWRGCQRAGGGVRRGNKGRRARSRHRLASDPAPSPPPCVMAVVASLARALGDPSLTRRPGRTGQPDGCACRRGSVGCWAKRGEEVRCRLGRPCQIRRAHWGEACWDADGPRRRWRRW